MFNKTKKKDKKYIDFIIELDYVEIILLKDITKEYFFFFLYHCLISQTTGWISS